MPKVRRLDANNDSKKSFVDWGKLSTEALKLKCNQYSLLATGRKSLLQQRLFKHFNTGSTVPPPSSSANDTVISVSDPVSTLNIDVLNELQHLRSEIQHIKTSMQQPPTHDPIPSETQHEQHASHPILPETQHTVSAAGHTNANANLSCEPYTGTLQTQAPVYGFREVAPGQGMSVNNPIITNDSSTVVFNPYTLPPIKSSTLSKVQKHEYIDFDELIPPPPSINTDQYFGLELDEFSSSLLLKKTKQKFQIRDFPSWMCAWNVFVQAYLHFHPTMQFDLFNYLKIFCTLIKKFKFENCYAYDKAQRTQLASQRIAPPHQQSISWQQQNEELFNLYLRDNYLPACFHCNTYGHFATSCPFKTAKRSIDPRNLSNNFRPSSSQYSYVSTGNNKFQPSSQPPMPQSSSSFTVNNTDNHPYCQRFNRTGFCNKPPCKFNHICNKCNKPGHPGIRCFSHTSSGFLP